MLLSGNVAASIIHCPPQYPLSVLSIYCKPKRIPCLSSNFSHLLQLPPFQVLLDLRLW